jgi:hypothetical protein
MNQHSHVPPSTGLSVPALVGSFPNDRGRATFLYAGIDLLQSDLLSGHMGRQIKGRITIHEMRPYSNGTRVQRDAWEELILGIESLLPLGRHPEGSLASLTSYLYDRTGGSIGSLRALLSDAAIAAILDGAEKADRKLLDTVPTDHAAEEFRSRTPVKQDGAPTPLRRAE